MPRYNNHKKTNRYTQEFKAKAVQLSHLTGVQVKDVAQTLDIHPFMLSRCKEYGTSINKEFLRSNYSYVPTYAIIKHVLKRASFQIKPSLTE